MLRREMEGVNRNEKIVWRIELHDTRSGCLQAVDLTLAEQRYGFATVAIHRARL